ncbi:MAG TPA: hypothetical protein ENN36_00720 [Candidatus Bathyarchaeota archaeon]|nr:hypothetical protein [Candidatus Bathyarchaeota archaeon]
MLNLTKETSRTKIIAITSIFTALYAVLRIIPTVPMIGASGASFSLSDIVAPLYGLILGPYIGGLSIIIGSLIAFFGKPPVFLGLDFLPATVAAVSLGLLIKRKWIPVIALNLVLLVAFLLHPNTSVFVNVPLSGMAIPLPFAWLHIVALLALISPLGRKAVEWVSTPTAAKAATGIAILFFIGTMMQHLTGNLLFETVMAYPIGTIPIEAYPGIWTSIFFVYPIERAALVVLGTIIGTPLLRVLKNTLLANGQLAT